MKKTIFFTVICSLFFAGKITANSQIFLPQKNLNLAQDLPEKPIETNKEIKLLNAGKYPRQQLSFFPRINTIEKSKMTVDVDVVTYVNDKNIPREDTLPNQTNINVQVKQIDDNGDIHLNLSYNSIESGTELSSNNFFKSIDRLDGLTGDLIVDSRRNRKKVVWNIPNTVDSERKQLLQQVLNSTENMSFPIPASTVGVGAQWQVTNYVNFNGINIKQTSTYEIINMQEDVITLNIDTVQQAQPQKLSGLIPNTAVNLISFQGQGKGKAVLDLNKFTPISSTISFTYQTLTQVGDASTLEPNKITMNASMKMSLESLQ